jgi:integrase/recombinase XerC
MGTELVRVDPGHQPPAPIAADLISAILATLNARTAQTYLSDYRDFARFVGAANARAAVNAFIEMGPGEANRCALGYRVYLTERGLSSGTIARRLVALRSACRAARRIGRIAWSLDVPAPQPRPFRDTRGPGRDGWRRMLEVANAEATTPQGKRNLALIRLLHDLALRRAEAVSLDLADVDLGDGTVLIVGKGRREPDRLTLTRQARAALADWIAARGERPGPVFVPLDPGAGPDERLTGEGVRLIVAGIGKRAGLSRVPRPHGLRHQSITAALDKGVDVREVRKFSRHAKLDTITVYDDNRTDTAGKVAQIVADD